MHKDQHEASYIGQICVKRNELGPPPRAAFENGTKIKCEACDETLFISHTHWHYRQRTTHVYTKCWNKIWKNLNETEAQQGSSLTVGCHCAVEGEKRLKDGQVDILAAVQDAAVADIMVKPTGFAMLDFLSTGEVKISCQGCKSVFKWYSDLKTHLTYSYTATCRAAFGITRELFPCQACQVPFTSRVGLSNHLSEKYENGKKCIEKIAAGNPVADKDDLDRAARMQKAAEAIEAGVKHIYHRCGNCHKPCKSKDQKDAHEKSYFGQICLKRIELGLPAEPAHDDGTKVNCTACGKELLLRATFNHYHSSSKGYTKCWKKIWAGFSKPEAQRKAEK